VAVGGGEEAVAVLALVPRVAATDLAGAALEVVECGGGGRRSWWWLLVVSGAVTSVQRRGSARASSGLL